MSHGEERFPFNTPSPWVQETDTKLKWCAALEATGPENVRLILGHTHRCTFLDFSGRSVHGKGIRRTMARMA